MSIQLCSSHSFQKVHDYLQCFFWLFSLQNDESPSVGFKLQVGELKDMKILNSLRRPGDIDRIFLETKKNRVQES